MGSAVLEASREAIQQMVVMAADVLKVKVEQIEAFAAACAAVKRS